MRELKNEGEVKKWGNRKKFQVMFDNSFYFLFLKTCFWEY